MLYELDERFVFASSLGQQTEVCPLYFSLFGPSVLYFLFSLEFVSF